MLTDLPTFPAIQSRWPDLDAWWSARHPDGTPRYVDARAYHENPRVTPVTVDQALLAWTDEPHVNPWLDWARTLPETDKLEVHTVLASRGHALPTFRATTILDACHHQLFHYINQWLGSREAMRAVLNHPFYTSDAGQLGIGDVPEDFRALWVAARGPLKPLPNRTR